LKLNILQIGLRASERAVVNGLYNGLTDASGRVFMVASGQIPTLEAVDVF